MRRGSFDSLSLSELIFWNNGTLEQSPSNGHSYGNITGTKQNFLEQYDTLSESSGCWL